MTPQDQEAKQAEERFLQAVREEKLKVRPRWYFVLRTTFLVSGCILALLFFLYLASFIVFTLRQTGIWFAPAFGTAGWFTLFRSLPWLLILFCALFGAVLFALVKQYAFVYEQPLIYLLGAIVGLAIVGGFLVAETPLHEDLFSDARHNGLPPPIEAFYRDFGAPPMGAQAGDIHRGTIVTTTSDGFMIEDLNDATSVIIIASGTNLPPDMYFEPGNDVVIFGERTASGTIDAQGIQVIAR